ncbi:D-glycero-beta-D-manno-heptose 1,7-bisphosphate 7-phosphatase [Thalassotalea atypica]|uniref:D-glycero-beta-D-manno-heptose 1,7-bisphosphate 7-phosphatase n=1 Tax=Thalassotalea atypica TaxID=2054316 RepID=UPI002572EEA9|nr:D-glycero-beta-D-manno-heptose 1,7-bisphosphate 7-phosphatase [Thalassotalea atypica]
MKKALFLDRDGIINVDFGYVHKISDFEFVEGIMDLCRYASDMGYEIYVITNQAGIARGYYSIDDFNVLTDWMIKVFKKEDIAIKGVYFCPHHPEKGTNDFVVSCKCRKPEPGMILQAVKEHELDVNKSVFIGDKLSDMHAAEAAGIHNRVLVASQYHDNSTAHVHRVNNIKEAIAFLS